VITLRLHNRRSVSGEISRYWAARSVDISDPGGLCVTRSGAGASSSMTQSKRVASIQIQKTKESVFCPTTKRLEVFAAMRGDFLMCAIGSDARDFLHNKGAVVSEALLFFDKRDLKEGAIALEALHDTPHYSGAPLAFLGPASSRASVGLQKAARFQQILASITVLLNLP
jgi:hypothetical protein